MRSEEQKRKNREYTRNYMKCPANKKRHKEWLQNHPENVKNHRRKNVQKNRTEERKCIICGKVFKVIINHKLKYLDKSRTKKTCSPECRKIHYRNQRRKWTQSHLERVKEKAMEIRQNLKFSVMAIYSEGQPKCACCGETIIEFLTMDHINNNGAEHRRCIFGKYSNQRLGGYPFYAWIKNNDFPEDLQVLCMNCQLGRKFNNGVCPHEERRQLSIKGLNNSLRPISVGQSNIGRDVLEGNSDIPKGATL